MPIIGFVAQKGGAGKTTLAVHLSVVAGDAVLVDLDPQGSAAEWWESREAEAPAIATGRPADLGRSLATLTEHRRYILVDTAPFSDEHAEAVARHADLVVIPSRAAILDLRAIRPTVELVRRVGTPAVIVLNAVPAGKTTAEASVVTAARVALSAYGLPVCPVAIGHRMALQHALNDGRTAVEYEPDGKAAQEIKRLWRWIDEQAKIRLAGSRGRGTAPAA
jgi:chromosome partitioning protein